MIPLVGFLPGRRPARASARSTRSSASCCDDGFVARYTTEPDGRRRPAARRGRVPALLVLAGRQPRACIGPYGRGDALFERLLGLRNDVGLLAEEYDPGAGRLLGNFPQAFTHVSLVNTAGNLWARTVPRWHRPPA